MAERDYLQRTIATIRHHRAELTPWPQWANELADEVERLWAREAPTTPTGWDGYIKIIVALDASLSEHRHAYISLHPLFRAEGDFRRLATLIPDVLAERGAEIVADLCGAGADAVVTRAREVPVRSGDQAE